MAKRIVLCLDGTWNSPSQEQQKGDGSVVFRPTNVLKVARAVKPVADDGTEQVVYYDTGIGAMAQYPGLTNSVLRWFDSKLGGAWGAGFEGNVDDAYRFLANNYEDGDTVYVFGYSRGAAQAQALCKFVSWMRGCPVKNDAYYIPKFYFHYLNTKGRREEFDVVKNQIERDGEKPLEPFRNLVVNFLGLWDTVVALGWRTSSNTRTSDRNKRFLVDTALPERVIRARHAIAIDERRKDFRAEVWQEGNAHDDMEQRWFPGGHGNVGGGRRRDGLANNALRWVLGEAAELEVDEGYLRFFRRNPYDELSAGLSLFYKLRNLRAAFRKDGGARPILGHPQAANVVIDGFSLKRLGSAKGEVTENGGGTREEEYWPGNLVDYLIANPSYDDRLSAAALARIESLREGS